jgi:hypothetical protein
LYTLVLVFLLTLIFPTLAPGSATPPMPPALLVPLFTPIVLLFALLPFVRRLYGSTSGPHGTVAGLGSLALLLV